MIDNLLYSVLWTDQICKLVHGQAEAVLVTVGIVLLNVLPVVQPHIVSLQILLLE